MGLERELSIAKEEAGAYEAGGGIEPVHVDGLTPLTEQRCIRAVPVPEGDHRDVVEPLWKACRVDALGVLPCGVGRPRERLVHSHKLLVPGYDGIGVVKVRVAVAVPVVKAGVDAEHGVVIRVVVVGGARVAVGCGKLDLERIGGDDRDREEAPAPGRGGRRFGGEGGAAASDCDGAAGNRGGVDHISLVGLDAVGVQVPGHPDRDRLAGPDDEHIGNIVVGIDGRIRSIARHLNQAGSLREARRDGALVVPAVVPVVAADEAVARVVAAAQVGAALEDQDIIILRSGRVLASPEFIG